MAPAGFSLATDIAEWLVRQGVPFRVAHELGRRVRGRAESTGRGLHELTDAELADISAALTPAVRAVLSVEGSLAPATASAARRPPGCAEQLAALRDAVAADRAWVAGGSPCTECRDWVLRRSCYESLDVVV